MGIAIMLLLRDARTPPLCYHEPSKAHRAAHLRKIIMLSLIEINRLWESSLRTHASTMLEGERGPYLAIGAKTMALLDPLWKAPHSAQPPDIGAMLAAGKDVRVFGDPHFQHANIIRMCERPFDNVDDMDGKMWNALETAHADADFVICVGDWALRDPISWLRKTARAFPGKQLTVVGNHDAKGSKPDQWIEMGARASLAFSIDRELAKTWVERREPDMAELIEWRKLPKIIHVGMSHWPIPPQRMPSASWINLHGHIHNEANRPLRANCSMEAIGFAPRSIERLVDARILDDLARRQSGLEGFVEESVRSEDLASGL